MSSMAPSEALPDDFHALLARLDAMAQEPSPESEPYAAQYRVREILQKLLTTALSPVEAACASARLGAIHMNVEEPHNAQPALERAVDFFFPGLLTFTSAITSDDGQQDAISSTDVEKLLASLPSVQLADVYKPYAGVALELLNNLGVLWSNRSRPLRALSYLSVCDACCDSSQHADVRTHTHFFLAQVYGSLGLADTSARFCLSTLELQLVQCVRQKQLGERYDGAIEWVRNVLKLVDFYLDTDQAPGAATCLQAAEFMLQTHSRDPERSQDDVEQHQLLEAEVYATWSRLHLLSLQLAGLRHEGLACPHPLECPLPSPSSMDATLASLSASEPHQESFDMTYVAPEHVTSFDDARRVFKMGVLACTRARRVLVLDGFVTQHVRLLQRESALFKRLLVFEPARGRRVAMQRRRLALLTPLLGDALSVSAYGHLLQELYYECAEVNADILELKQSKNEGEGEAAKASSYGLKAVHCYQQFLLLYYPSSGSSDSDKARNAVLQGGKQVQLPPSEALAPREFRSVLRGFFGLAHVWGKVVFAADAAKTVGCWRQSLAYHEAVLELVHKYEKRDDAQARELRQSFEAELAICADMVGLLPEKINQLVYNGKAL